LRATCLSGDVHRKEIEEFMLRANLIPMSVADEISTQIARRRRQLGSIWAAEGARGIVKRFRTSMSDRIRPKGMEWAVLPQDVVRADLARPFKPSVPPLRAGERIAVNWVMGPAGPGSGGHTTNYRMVRYLEDNGFVNRVYFYDPYGGDHLYYEKIARDFYGVRCPIASIAHGMADAHAVVATGWPSAYAVFNARGSGKRFYFVQDYEPHFYPVGAKSLLAENSYRMGFHGITAGAWLAEKLSRDFGMIADPFPFGCDTEHYHLDPLARRTGIAFYARAETPRRGVEIGLLALEIFARKHPQITLHFYGQKMGEMPFRFVNHGVINPTQLNAIYNQCYAGLSLSLTNVSLVPQEMLAAGCIPVVNDAAHNRMVLANPYVRYADATPHALATALDQVVTSPDFATTSRRAADSVRSTSWDDAGAAVAAAIRRALALP
jgi:glycosyltransferase involved in cell wall biosynthesis